MKRSRRSGFTLTELAVVLSIVASCCSAALMCTLRRRPKSRNRDETLRRLEQSKELLLSFRHRQRAAAVPGALLQRADVQRRGDGGDEQPAGGGVCTDGYAGYLPGRTPSASSRSTPPATRSTPGTTASAMPCRRPRSGAPAQPLHHHGDNLKTNGIAGHADRSADLRRSTAAGSTRRRRPAAPRPTCVTNQTVVAAVVWSQGKNWRDDAGGQRRRADQQQAPPARGAQQQSDLRQARPAPGRRRRRRVRRPDAVDPGRRSSTAADRAPACCPRARQRRSAGKADLAVAVRSSARR